MFKLPGIVTVSIPFRRAVALQLYYLRFIIRIQLSQYPLGGQLHFNDWLSQEIDFKEKMSQYPLGGQLHFNRSGEGNRNN